MGGSRGRLLYPYRALFAPLEAEYGTRFDSKPYIMVQLQNVYWVGITNTFLAYWGPFGGSQKAILWANDVPLGPLTVK